MWTQTLAQHNQYCMRDDCNMDFLALIIIGAIDYIGTIIVHVASQLATP